MDIADISLSQELKTVFDYMENSLIKEFPAEEYKTHHLLCSIFSVKSCIAYKTLDNMLMSTTFSNIKNIYEQKLSEDVSKTPDSETVYSDEINELIELSVNERDKIGAAQLKSIHVLLALLNPENKDIPHYSVFEKLKGSGITYVSVLKRTTPTEQKKKVGEQMMEGIQMPSGTDSLSQSHSLKKYCNAVICNDTDRFIGRESEIGMLFTVLSKMHNKNAIVVGESGCGKSRFLREVNSRIENRNCPEGLYGKKLITLSITSLISGTTLRGMLEERVDAIMTELKNSKSKFILCIDGMDQAFTGDNKENDLTSFMETIFSDNEISIIATITPSSYHKNIEKNNIISNNVTKVRLNNLSNDEISEIISNQVPEIEKHHGVRFEKEVVDKVPMVCSRYFRSKSMPSSAIDFLDTMGASKSHIRKTNDNVAKLEQMVESLSNERERLQKEGKFEESGELSVSLNKKRSELVDAKKNGKNRITVPITMDDVRTTVETMTNIPSANVSVDEMNCIRGMEDKIKKHVIGQDEAIDSICRSIKRNRIGLKQNGKTIGSFLLIGSTGCGKTLVAKKIAEILFGEKDSLIRIDMSEYSDKTSVNKLIGSPAGYVGYDKGGVLTDRIKEHPYCVLLLDEIEKAHPEVINTFLQVLDEGRLSDNSGYLVDFTNVLILMTSNIGMKRSQELSKSIGFVSTDKSQEISEKELKKFFSPEFINRIDDVIYFNKLGEKSLRMIIGLELDKLKERVNEIGFMLNLYDDVIDDLMLKISGNENMGARPIIRAIQDNIENKIIDQILEGNGDNEIFIDKI